MHRTQIDTQIGDAVRLLVAIPELSLRAGQTGRVQSIWNSRTTAYEIEITPDGSVDPLHVLVLAEKVQILTDVPLRAAA